MSRRRSWVGLMVWTLVIWMPADAALAEPSVRAIKAEALHRQALTHAKKRRWKPAIELWDAAEELSPDWRFAFNLASSNAHLKRWRQAWAALIRVRGHGVNKEQAGLVDDLAKKIERNLLRSNAWVELKVAPADAKVTHNGVPWPRPFMGWLSGNRSTFRISHPDHEPRTLKVEHKHGARISRDVVLKRSARPQAQGWVKLDGAPNVAFHTATPLTDGRVLVTGGRVPVKTSKGRMHQGVSAKTWVFSSETKRFRATQPLRVPRTGHAAIRLKDGRVMVAGGDRSTDRAVNSCEVFDPKTHRWQDAPAMLARRFGHAAVSLSNGDIVVVGGHSGHEPHNSLERWEIKTGVWRSIAGKLSGPSMLPAAVRVDTGNVLIAGGLQGDRKGSTALHLYNPMTDAVTRPSGNLGSPRWGAMITSLPDGRVLIVGGYCNCLVRGDDVFDPLRGTITTIGHPGVPPQTARLLTLVDGRALLVGGLHNTSKVDPSQTLAFTALRGGTWSNVASLNMPRWNHTATLMRDGSVVVIGGKTSSRQYSNTAELLFP